MKKAVTFGELMLRLAPENYLRFVQTKRYEATFGGAEANVSVSLANYGVDVAFVSKLPTHEIGQAAVNSLREFGVDTSKIVRGGDRVGIYYCEKGASQRPSKVIYDRAYSAIAMAKRSDFDWDKIFDGVEWFHFTGITPALSDEMAEVCLDACKKAKEKNITIKDMLKILVRNKQLLVMAVIVLFYTTASGFLTAFGQNFFYFKFGYDGNLVFIFTVIYAVGGVLGTIILVYVFYKLYQLYKKFMKK